MYRTYLGKTNTVNPSRRIAVLVTVRAGELNGLCEWLTEGVKQLGDRLAEVRHVVDGMRSWSQTLPLLRRGCRLTRTRRLTGARLRRLTGARLRRLTAARSLRPGLASFSLARRHAQAQAVDELHESAEVEHVGDPCGAETLAGPLGPAKVAGTRSTAHTGVVHSVLEELVWSAKELAKELGVLKK